MLRASAMIVVASVLCAPRASAQQPDSRLVGRLSASAVDSIAALARVASARRLPVEPLIQKALEGHSKGATESVLLDAVRGLLQRLERAATIMGREAVDADLVAAAGAIYLGVSQETLRRVNDAYADRSLAVPLVVLTDMIRKGVRLETASDLIVQLVEARVDVAGLQDFRRLVERDIDLGAPPGEAATIRARGALLQVRGSPSGPFS